MNIPAHLPNAKIADIINNLTVNSDRRPISHELATLEWLHIAERLKYYLTQEYENLPHDELIRTYAAFIYALDMEEKSGKSGRNRRICEQLTMIATLLRMRPPDKNVEPLNPDAAFELFLTEVDMSIGQAREASANWRLRDVREIRRLREVKNLLNSTLLLRPFLSNPTYREELDEWATLLPLLP